MDLTVLYRGPLVSCDYDCPYCPFAKRRDSTAQLYAERGALERFARWATDSEDNLSLLFTPWGEGSVRSWYRRTLTEPSRLPHVRGVAIQTNLSCRTGWLAEADLDTLALCARTTRARPPTTVSSASAMSRPTAGGGSVSACSACPSI